MPAPPAPILAPRGRWRRWLLRLLALTGAALLGTLGLVVTLIRYLDHPRVKDRIRALAHDAGADIDYGSTQVRLLAGLLIRDVVVQTPPRFRARAPKLRRLVSLEFHWSVASLSGRLTRVALRDLTLTVVSDADGRTSLS